MSLLFLDLETSGLIRKDVPLGDPGQPWAIKVALDHCQSDGRSINRLDVTIKADGRKVKEAAGKVHGIEAAMTERVGLAENAVLAIIGDLGGKVETVVTYGDFDPQVIESLMIRLAEKMGKPETTYSRKWRRPGLEFVNLMAPYCQMACKLPQPDHDSGEYKWPSLDESCRIILGEDERTGLHDAWDDLCRVKRLYFALRERGHFQRGAA